MVAAVVPPRIGDDEVDLVDVFVRVIGLDEPTAALLVVRLHERHVLGEHFSWLGGAADEGVAHDGGDKRIGAAHASDMQVVFAAVDGVVADPHDVDVFELLASGHVLLLLQVEAGYLRRRHGGFHLRAHEPQVRDHGGRRAVVRRENLRAAQPCRG